MRILSSVGLRAKKEEEKRLEPALISAIQIWREEGEKKKKNPVSGGGRWQTNPRSLVAKKKEGGECEEKESTLFCFRGKREKKRENQCAFLLIELKD